MPPLKAVKRNQTIGYFSAFVGLGLATASLGPALPYFAANTKTQIGEVSILFSTKAAGYLLGSVLGGRLIDRFSGHLVAGMALLGVAITLALAPVLPLLFLLAAILFLLGMVEGVIDVGGNAMLVWVHGREVGPYMNALHFFFGIGTFIAPIIIAQSVLRSGEISWGFWVIALLVVPAAAWFLRVPSPRSPSHDSEHGGRTHTGVLILVVLFLFMYVGAEVGFGGWLYTYALEQELASETTAAYLTSAFWGAFTLGRLFSIPIAAVVRPRWILLGDLLGSGLSLVLILAFINSIVMLWAGTILLGLFMASIFPTIFSLAERRMTMTGKVTSWFFVGASAGGMFFPWLMGQLFEGIRPSAIMVVLLGNLVAAFLFYIVLMLVSGSISPQEGQPAR
jgi:FHS family Na+ dependent glucose MFS transporter 1